MKKSNKKKKRKSLKKIIKTILTNIKNFFVNIYIKFKKLPKKLQKLIILWLAIFIIIVVLIFFCGTNKKIVVNQTPYTNTYQKPTVVVSAALDYVKTRELYPTKDQKMRLNINTLIENGDLYDDAVDKSCIGYALIFYDEDKSDYNVKAYLSCKNYETDGYTFIK